MKALLIDTTRKNARIVVIDDEKKVHYVSHMDENVKHSEGLLLYIEKALSDTSMAIKDFDYLSAVVGPGSFTGIRVGMATIKGFNKVACKKILPLNTFEIVKNHVKNGVVILNSTSTAYYYAIIENKIIKNADVVDKVNIDSIANGKKVYYLLEEQNVLNLEYNNTEAIDNLDDMYYSAIEEYKYVADREFVPYYLQLSQAERNLK